MTWLEYDPALIDEIAARMDLREPNKAALASVVSKIQVDEFNEVVCDLATGVGKTYIMAALVEYLATQGIRNILIVSPGKTVQDKTIANFTPGERKYVPGADYQPTLITAENYSGGYIGDALHDPDALKLFLFNVQQLIRPTAKTSRRVRRMDEVIGLPLYDHLRNTDALVVIADEHHVYRSAAKVFSSAIRDLGPRALVGLTATPDPADEDKVIYRYTLAEAIADELVKVPVIVYREDGHAEVETQLADACHLLQIKTMAYARYAEQEGVRPAAPVLFVVCQTIEDAEQTADLLARDEFIGDANAVLLITAQSPDKDLAALAEVDDATSPIRAVVSVDKLKEGWDVKNIGVIVALRKLASQALTEQILGRGLRLPFGKRVGVPMIDQVDVVAHDSYVQLLKQKDALIERIAPARARSSALRSGRPEGATVTVTGASDDASSFDSEIEEHAEQGALRLVTRAHEVDGQQVDGSASLILQDYNTTVAQGKRDANEYRVLARVPGAPQIRFPRRERRVEHIRFSLSLVKDADARRAGEAFAQEIEVPLIREALSARRTLDGQLEIEREAQQSEVATQQWLPLSSVAEDLRARVENLPAVMLTLPESHAAKRLVKEFLAGAGATADQEVEWSAARARLAVNGLQALVRREYNKRQLEPDYEFNPITVPVEPLPMPTDVRDRYAKFERNRWYSGWTKSILPIASFDARTTEYALANIFENAAKVARWLRLRAEDNAYIELKASRYFPDFIVIDTQGEYWLVEGKSDRDAESHDALVKKEAAEEWSRIVTDDGRYGVWHYLFCTEDSIKKARGSWDALVVGAPSES